MRSGRRSSSDPVTSLSLLIAIRDRDNHQAWRRFMRLYQPVIISYAKHLGLTHDGAHDAAQETFAAFSAQLERYKREKGRLCDWLRGIARNKIAAIRRQNRRGKVISDLSDGSRLIRNLEDPDSTASTKLWEELWQRAIYQDCLRIVRKEVNSQTYRAFYRCVMDEIKPAKVAVELDVEPNIVHSAKHRVMQRIRELKNTLEPAD